MHSPIRHGDVLLLPVRSAPAGTREQVTSCIVGGSVSGPHHVLDSDRVFSTIVAADGDLYVDLDGPTRLLHRRAHEQHPELEVPAGTWRVLGRTA
jgi:hypothetical protein